MTDDSRVVYVIASSAPPALRLEDLLRELVAAEWTPCVIATPTLATWMDLGSFAKFLKWPIRVQPRTPSEQDPLPPASAVLAAPLTFNSLNKWAAGISDTLALGLLNEAIGLDVPIVAAPVVKTALRKHPAYGNSVSVLRRCGVRVLDPDAITIRPIEGLVTLDWPVVVAELAEALRGD